MVNIHCTRKEYQLKQWRSDDASQREPLRWQSKGRLTLTPILSLSSKKDRASKICILIGHQSRIPHHGFSASSCFPPLTTYLPTYLPPSCLPQTSSALSFSVPLQRHFQGSPPLLVTFPHLLPPWLPLLKSVTIWSLEAEAAA